MSSFIRGIDLALAPVPEELPSRTRESPDQLLQTLQRIASHAQIILRRDAMYEMVGKLRHAIKQVSPGLDDPKWRRFDRWPAEVLARTAHHLDLHGRITFSKVCRHIRFALFAEPSLWNTISLTDSPKSHDKKLWRRAFKLFELAETTSEGLHLSVREVTHLTHPHVLRRLYQALDVVSTLRLGLKVSRPHVIFWKREIDDPVCDLFTRPNGAPHLRCLQLELPSRLFAPDVPELPATFLGGSPGQLEECSLLYLRLADGVVYGAFAGLRALTYVAPKDTTMSAEGLWVLLASMPRLEIFGMSSIRFAPGTTRQPKLLCPHLRLVNLKFIASGSASLMEFFVQVPEVVMIYERTRDPDLFAISPASDLHMSISKSELRFSDRSSGLLQSTDDKSERLRTFSFLRRILAWGTHQSCEDFAILSAHVERIVSLTLPEELWERTVTKMPSLPSLKDLGIVLTTCKEERDRSELYLSGLFVGRLDEPAQCQLPALENLYLYSGEHLWKPQASCSPCAWFLEEQSFALEPDEPRERHCSCLAGLTISLADVAHFIRTLPLSHGQRLKKLILGGVSAVVDFEPAAAMAGLLELVDEVDSVEYPPEKLVKFVVGELDYEALPRSHASQNIITRFHNTELEPSRRSHPPRA